MYLCGWLFNSKAHHLLSLLCLFRLWLPSASSCRTVHCLLLSLCLTRTPINSHKPNKKRSIAPPLAGLSSVKHNIKALSPSRSLPAGKWKSPMMTSEFMTAFCFSRREMGCTMTVMGNRQSLKGKNTSGKELASAGRDLFCNQVQFCSEFAQAVEPALRSSTGLA